MRRRDLIRAMGAGLGAVALPGLSFSRGARANDRPNVLFIAVDDLRPELGCYGHPMVKSPNIDGLAASGMLFTRTYCQQAICAPSRASLLSGCRPDTTRIYDLYTPLRKAMPDVLSLPQHFKNNGYRTISLGKIYHHGIDDKIGWSERPRTGGRQYCLPENLAYMGRRTAEARKLGIKDPIKFYNYSRPPATEVADVADSAYHDGAMTDVAIEMLRQHRDDPFFLAVGYHKPHLPFNAPKKYWDLYDRAAIPLPNSNEPTGAPRYATTNWGELRAYSDMPEKGDLNEAQTRRLIHGYYACVSYVDALIGRLLDELDRLKLRDNTVVVLWGDHGWKLGDYGDWCKHTNFELDTHVPMVLSAPGFTGGRKCHALTEFVDVYPTLAELCGLSVPKHCEGDSVVPLLSDAKRPWKSAAFSQYPRGRRIMGYSVRTDRWRYTEWRDRRTGEVEARELYDHASDPFAYANVVDKPEHLPLVNGLAAKLRGGWETARPPAK